MPNFFSLSGRLLVTLVMSYWLGLPGFAATPPSPGLLEALALFRAEGPAGWGYVQTSESRAESLVERFDPARPELSRWSLLKKNGRVPDVNEVRAYNEGRSRRSAGYAPPRLQDQLRLDTAELMGREDGVESWRFRLKPAGADDAVAIHLVARLTVNLSTRSITRVQLSSMGSFSPMVGVNITESSTDLIYSLPTEERPSLLMRAILLTRGRAFWFRSLDDDMVVDFSGHERTRPLWPKSAL